MGRRPCLRPNTSLEPINTRAPSCPYDEKKIPIKFLSIFPQQFNDPKLTNAAAATYEDLFGPIFFNRVLQPRVPTLVTMHSGFIFVHQSSLGTVMSQGGTEDLKYARRDVRLNIYIAYSICRVLSAASSHTLSSLFNN